MSKYGYHISSLVLLSRNVNNGTIKASRLGLSISDDDCMKTAVQNWQTAYKTYLVSTGNTLRKKRTTYNSISCAQLTSGPSYAFTAAELSGLDPAVFTSCVSILSASTNYYSTAQLSALYGVAKVI